MRIRTHTPPHPPALIGHTQAGRPEKRDQPNEKGRHRLRGHYDCILPGKSTEKLMSLIENSGGHQT